MIQFESGYESEFTLSKVNPMTWENSELVGMINSMSVSRDCTDQTPLLETATVSLDMAAGQSFDTGWYRIEMLATQNMSSERFPIATMLMESSSGSIQRGYDEMSVDGYSVLKPLADRVIFPGEYVPKGMQGLQYLVKILQECTPAPVVTEGSFTLNNPYVFDVGTSYLSALWDILDAAGWCCQISGNGTVTLKELPSQASFTLDRSNLGMLQPEISYDLDLSNVPNRYLVVDGYDSACVVNDSVNSPTSTVNKGWYVDMFDSNPVTVNGESLENYATRMLKSASIVTKQWSYTREFVPDLLPFDRVNAYVPEYGWDGTLRIMTQNLVLNKGVTVTEKVGQEIQEWS